MNNNHNFKSLALSEPLLLVVDELGYEKMTPIQAQSIPLLLQGRDVIGESKTGSGKTAAFGLPILEKMIDKLSNSDRRDRQVHALILCPTRELCTQVAREMRRLGRRLPGMQILILSGGQPMHPQLSALSKGAHCVVGTPGRVLDHIRRGSIDLSQTSTFVLDEADRMLDMGFQDDMEEILNALPETRQTVFFSATFPKSIESMSRQYQNNPARVTINADSGEPGQGSERTTPTTIRQYFFESAPQTKLNGLLWVIQQNNPESAIIFCNLKTTVIDLTRALLRAGLSCAAIHGDLEQPERDRVMAKFRNKSIRMLIATDVASRGIDIENLDAVFNYDVPAQPAIYVHRIGRTGRAGKSGLAISLVSPRERSKILAFEKLTGTPITEKTLAKVEELQLEDFRKQFTDLQQEPEMATLYISGGRKDKMRPGDVLGALTGEAGGLQGTEVGKIEIHDRFSYVAVSKPISQTALERLRNGKIKGRKFKVEFVR